MCLCYLFSAKTAWQLVNQKADFFYKTNRIESIRITNRIDSNRELECSSNGRLNHRGWITVAEWRPVLVQFDVALKHKLTINILQIYIVFVSNGELFVIVSFLDHGIIVIVIQSPLGVLLEWTTEKRSWVSGHRKKWCTTRCCRTPTSWTRSRPISWRTSRRTWLALFSWGTSRSAAVTGPDSSASLYEWMNIFNWKSTGQEWP